MSKNFHYNPTTGHVAKCKASVKPCPWGEDVHYPTAAQARQGFEQGARRALESLPRHQRKFASVDPALSSVIDIDLLRTMRKEGFILMAQHPQDPSMRILTYSPLAQAMGKWNSATKSARGLVIRSEKDDFSDAVILERPWNKFYTLQQMEKGWHLGDDEEGAEGSADDEMTRIDFEAPAEVTDKCDGSMGILYVAPDKKLALCTRGSFASEQAAYYTKLLRNNKRLYEGAEALKTHHPSTSFMFELVGPDNQIVLEHDNDDIIFLGAVEKESGLYRSTRDYEEEWASKGLSVAETIPARNLTEALALPDRPNREGMVVRIGSDDPTRQMMLKIKQQDYLQLHRLTTSLSKTTARELTRESKATMPELLEAGRQEDFNLIPELGERLEHVRNGSSTFHKRVYSTHAEHLNNTLVPKLRTMYEAHERIKALPDEAFKGRSANKEFAESVANEPNFLKSQLFAFYNARAKGIPMEEMKTKAILSSLSRSI